MKRVYKGEFGYIKYRTKLTVVRTVLCAAVAIGLFLVGLLIYHTQKNVFSIVAALGCLPTGWSAVNMIMFLRAKGCSEEDHKKIELHRGNLLIHYDHVITSYDKNFNISASTVLEKNICCYSSDSNIEISECEKHIKKMISGSGYSSYSIKIFTDINKFCERLDQLEKLRSDNNLDPAAYEDAWVPGTTQTVAGILLSISL